MFIQVREFDEYVHFYVADDGGLEVTLVIMARKASLGIDKALFEELQKLLQNHLDRLQGPREWKTQPAAKPS